MIEITKIIEMILDNQYNGSTKLIRMAKGDYEYITYKNILKKFITKIKNIKL